MLGYASKVGIYVYSALRCFSIQGGFLPCTSSFQERFWISINPDQDKTFAE